jgi:fumarylacetoacetase
MTAATWVPVDERSPFGLDALPWGVVTDGQRGHPAVRIGNHALLLDVVAQADLLAGVPGVDASTFATGTLDPLMDAGPTAWRDVRQRVRDLLAADSVLARDRVLRERVCKPLGGRIQPVLPFTVADYVDFYCSLGHATNMGRILRPDSEPLLPNWRQLPIGYHGRSGTVVCSGTPVRRPHGLRPGPDGPTDTPTYGPTRRLDLELEVGMVVGAPSPPGVPVHPDELDQHVFGFCLVNDWSARDVQAYEYRPLGPFLGKSFQTSVGPWIVPVAAVRGALTFPSPQSPTPARYLRATRPWALPATLEVAIQTADMRAADVPPAVVARTDFVQMYWTLAQMLAHVTANGAHLRRGDLYASGTVSGTEPGTYGSLMELSWGGQQPIELPTGETRTFLEDGDTVVLRGVTTRPDGARIGWGEVRGTIEPAAALVDAEA